MTPRTRAVVTIWPNNPTGAVFPERALRDVNALCRDRASITSAMKYDVLPTDRCVVSPGSFADAEGHTTPVRCRRPWDGRLAHWLHVPPAAGRRGRKYGYGAHLPAGHLSGDAAAAMEPVLSTAVSTSRRSPRRDIVLAELHRSAISGSAGRRRFIAASREREPIHAGGRAADSRVQSGGDSGDGVRPG
jgi:hypothetical protein